MLWIATLYNISNDNRLVYLLYGLRREKRTMHLLSQIVDDKCKNNKPTYININKIYTTFGTLLRMHLRKNTIKLQRPPPLRPQCDNTLNNRFASICICNSDWSHGDVYRLAHFFTSISAGCYWCGPSLGSVCSE